MVTAVLLVAADLAALYIVWKGVKMILHSIRNDSSSSIEPISNELYAFERYVRGEYIPRCEYNEIMNRNPQLSGGRQSRDYAKKMVKAGNW